ncbi:hypothetical protein [Actinoplanes sp. ATCC 53533]|uniref:hypothetical protein n=1 Tax=Actinoplanes sp. ATCC 53533 TaxID=1288362 RepID=UPI0018F3E7B0|nr:hypothetical protein [Actinoplanes sp. ATCC 53533]
MGQGHQALPGLFTRWTVLRPSWFMRNFIGCTPHARRIREDGAIRTASGSGRVGFVDADDIAAVAIRADLVAHLIDGQQTAPEDLRSALAAHLDNVLGTD